MKGIVIGIGLSLALAGCGGDSAQTGDAPADQPAPVGEVRLGMSPEEVVKAIGPAEFNNIASSAEGKVDILWTYKKRHHVVLKGEGGAADQDFPRGCILTFGGDGKKLTEVDAPSIPTERRMPFPSRSEEPAPPLPASLPALTSAEARDRAKALVSGEEDGLQAAVDRVMIRFPECLPFLVQALDSPDRKLSEGLRIIIQAPPGAPVDRLRRVHPSSRLALVLNVLNQGTGQHFGTPAKPEDIPAIAAQWKAWYAAVSKAERK